MDPGPIRRRPRSVDWILGRGRARHDPPTDEELLELFVSGDKGAFAELMERHEQRVFAVALKLTGNRADALDATQDTFLALLRRASTFQARSAFGTWLYQIAVNASRDILRKRRRDETNETDARAADSPMSDQGDALTARIDIARALTSLPQEFREAVALHDICDLSYEEIARITQAEIGTVKSRVSRGRRRLAKLMEQREDGRASKGERRPATPEVFPP